MGCNHDRFIADVDVTRFWIDKERDPRPSGYMASISIVCAECGIPFEFVGVPCGPSLVRPAATDDNLTMTFPIQPSTDPVHQVNALLNDNDS